jgi:ribonucleoside-diphosphate reductase alpha chain
VLLARALQAYGFTRDTKLKVPEVVWRGTEGCVKGYLRGLFQTDGTVNVSSNRQTCSIRLSSVHRPLLQDVQMLLANFGVFSRIHQRRLAGMRQLPDGQGGRRAYACQTLHELIIDGESREVFMQEIGFLLDKKRARYAEWVEGKALLKSQRFAAHVESITPIGRQPVFDTTQPDHNSVIFNGLVTGQCAEQPLAALRLLLPRQRRPDALRAAAVRARCRLRRRRLCPGVRGGHPHAGQRARRHGLAAAAAAGRGPRQAPRRPGLHRPGRCAGDAGPALRHRAGPRHGRPHLGRDARRRLRRQRRPGRRARRLPAVQCRPVLVTRGVRVAPAAAAADKIRAQGLRNSHLLSIAPTGTISLAFADNASNGIEPAFSWSYTRKKREPDNSFKHYAVEDHAWRLYRHLKGADAPLTDAFVTALEMSAEAHAAMVAAVAPYIDTSISARRSTCRPTTRTRTSRACTCRPGKAG